MPQNKHLRFLVIVLYAALGYVFIVFALPKLLSLFLPFILAFGIALISRPFTRFLHNKLKVPDKIAAFIALLIVVAVIALLITLLVNRLMFEFNNLVANLPKYIDTVQENFNKASDSLWKYYDAVPQNIADKIDEGVNGLAEGASSLIPIATQWTLLKATSVATMMPYTLFFIIAFFLGSYFMTADYERIGAFIKKNVPEKVTTRITQIKEYAITALLRYLKGLFIIMCVMFCVLLVAFWVLKINSALLLALVIALMDALPVLGMGLVLIPWGIISLIMGDISTGISLVLLYVLVVIIRQFIEPKIISSSLGLHPLITLIGMYLGFRLFGVGGIIIIPIIIIILVFLNRSGAIKIWKE